MKRPVASLVALLAFGALAQGSAVEDAAYAVCFDAAGEETAQEYCTYQHDGGRHGDASDECAQPAPTVQMGVPTSGAVFPPVPPGPAAVEDPEDDYDLAVAAGHVGDSLRVTLRPSRAWSPGAPVSYAVEVFGPGCLVSLASSGEVAVPWSGTVVDFVPLVAGNHTLRVTVSEVDAGLLETELPLGCHFMCAHLVTSAVGYNMLVNETP